jgi:hypothetical protein
VALEELEMRATTSLAAQEEASSSAVVRVQLLPAPQQARRQAILRSPLALPGRPMLQQPAERPVLFRSPLELAQRRTMGMLPQLADLHPLLEGSVVLLMPFQLRLKTVESVHL